MEKRVAVVFDSAGTLLHMYRAARDSQTGSILEDIETTSLVAQRPHRALVMMHTSPDQVLGCNPALRLTDFIDDNRVLIDISCSSSPFTLDDAFAIIRKDETKIGDIHDVLQWVMDHCHNVSYLSQGMILDGLECRIPYVLSTAGDLFPNTVKVMGELKDMGVDTYIASGDSMENLRYVASSVGVPAERVFGIATTHDKEHIVLDLKDTYDYVMMVGDGMNDILALRAADVGILSLQQGNDRPSKLKDSADSMIYDIIEILDIVNNI